MHDTVESPDERIDSPVSVFFKRLCDGDHQRGIDHALAVELTQMGTGQNSEVGIRVASDGGGGGGGTGGGRASAKKDRKKKKKRKKSTTNPFITTAQTQQIHVDANSGRRYTYNPKTRQSVWLK